MDKSVTVSVRGLVVVGFVLVAVTVAYLLGNARGNPAVAADSDDDDRPTSRTLTMRGVGEATAVPDQLGFTLNVAMVRPDLDTALADSSEAMRQVIAALKTAGVDEQDMQTTGLSMTPVYDHPRRQAPVLRGYRVSQQASIRVDDLDTGGEVVSAAVAAGGNAVRVNDLRLQVAEPESVLAEARNNAVEEATAKAAEYAEATGQELGEVLTITEVPTGGDRHSYITADYAMGAGAASAPILAGESELTAQVQVVWELR